MNYLKDTLFVKLSIENSRKILICQLYRSLLKSLYLQKFVSSDPFLKSYLKTRICINFYQSKTLSNTSEIYNNYWKGLEYLDLINNSSSEKNRDILTQMAYGPSRFIKAYAINHAIKHDLKIMQAEKIMQEEIEIKRLGYNHAVPQEFMDYIHSKPEDIRRFRKLCEPDYENILK